MIIIFGASGGVGKTLYTHFKGINRNCLGTYNLNNNSPDNSLLQLDITNLDDVQGFINSLPHKPFCIINCVGITDMSPLHKAKPQDWKKVIDINLIGSFNISRAILPKMRELNFGKIIHFGSIVSSKPIFGSSAYITSKSALKGLSQSINKENKKFGILSILVNLGYTEVGMINKVPQKVVKNIIDNSKYKRLCSKEEIIKTVEDILDDKHKGKTEINLFAGT